MRPSGCCTPSTHPKRKDTIDLELARPLALGVRKLIDPVYADPDVLMAQLTAWGKVNLVPPNEVERIKAGTGPIDAALRRPNDEFDRQLDLQARVWTLLVRQYERLWKDGAFIYGREVDEFVPPLGSRVVVKHKADPAPAPQ